MSTNKLAYEELERHLTEAQEEVRRCITFLDSVMEQSPFAMWISDAKGTVIKTNSALREILNLTDERIVGRYNVLKDGNLVEQGVMDQVRAVFDEGKPAKFSIQWVGAKAGTVGFERARDLWIDVSIFSIIDAEGNLTNAVCQWINVTDQKQKEKELRLSEEKYRNLVENMVDVIFTLDRSGLVSSINTSVKAMLGFDPEEVTGKHFTKWIPENQHPFIISVFERILDGEAIIDETVLIGKDGKAHNVDFRATCILKEDQIVGVQGILRDITEQKKAAEALRRTEEKYRMLFDGAMDAIFVADAQTGLLLDCNRAATVLTVREKTELIGRPQKILHPPQENEEDFSETFTQHLNGKKGKTLETQVITKTGQIKEVAIKASLLEIGGKKVLLGIFRDVTQSKRAQEEIESLSKFPSENPSPVLRAQRDGTILYSNEAALSTLTKLKINVGKKVPAKWRHFIDEAFETGHTERREVQIDDGIFSFVIAPIRDRDYVNLYARDITERKKIEADLRKSEERFKQVVEIAGDWVWEVDAEGLYTYASSVVEHVLGYKPEDIVGKKHFYDFFQPDVREELKKEAFETFRKRGSFVGFVNPCLHKDGRTVIFETSGTPIIDEKGDFCGYRGVDRDVTERQQRENELRKMNEDLKLASRRAGTAEVATDVLHNVGNVLNSINVSASFIEDKVVNSKVMNLKKVMDILEEHTYDLGAFLTEDERGKHIPLYLTEAVALILDEQAAIAEKLRSLTKNVEHVTQIIKAQQSYARTGNGEGLTSIHEVIEHAVEINHVALERYGIDLQFELADLPRIHMDKQRVLQILVNLITNAKQALTEKGKQNKVLRIRCDKHGEDRLRVDVIDNGVGIRKEHLPKIFTHGFTTKKSGHGFGLHGSALAAREMGGSLTVHSKGPGQGATFTLELPLIKSEAITNGCSK